MNDEMRKRIYDKLEKIDDNAVVLDSVISVLKEYAVNLNLDEAEQNLLYVCAEALMNKYENITTLTQEILDITWEKETV